MQDQAHVLPTSSTDPPYPVLSVWYRADLRMAVANGRHFARRISTETKAAYKTTEFLTYVVVGLAKSVAASPTTTATAARRLRAAPT